MTLDEAVAEFEKGFAVVREGAASFAAWKDGPIYFTVLCGGTKTEINEHFQRAWPNQCLTGSPDLAAQIWLWQAKAFAAGRGDALLWRTRPEIKMRKVGLWEPYNGSKGLSSVDMFGVYSRLIVLPQSEMPAQAAA